MGNSLPGYLFGDLLSVHPHVHGELVALTETELGSVGSSPRAWGTLNDIALSVLDVRFIPTCMGNSRTPSGSGTGTPVHPHVHGELDGTEVPLLDKTGSSPRAWGTRIRMSYNDLAIGSSPRAWGTQSPAVYR